MKNICVNCKKHRKCKEPCAFVTRLKEVAQEICLSCPQYDTCRTPCLLADAFITGESREIFEKGFDIGGTQILVMHPEHEKVDSFASRQKAFDDGKDYQPITNISTAEAEDFWSGVFYVTKNVKLAIFIDRFFNRLEWETLAVKYNMTAENVGSNYRKAKADIYKFINLINHEKEMYRRRQFAESYMQKASSFPKGLQAFFLHHLFGLTYKEVGEIVGISPDSVKTHIRHLTKDVKIGARIVKFDDDMNITQLNRREKENERKQASTPA